MNFGTLLGSLAQTGEGKVTLAYLALVGAVVTAGGPLAWPTVALLGVAGLVASSFNVSRGIAKHGNEEPTRIAGTAVAPPGDGPGAGAEGGNP